MKRQQCLDGFKALFVGKVFLFRFLNYLYPSERIKEKKEEEKMIFYNSEWENSNDIIVCGYYQRYWISKERREKNAKFDVYSGKILDLKDGKQGAIDFFYNMLNVEICDNVSICVVPSHNAKKQTSGIHLLAKKLVENGRKDLVYAIKRKYTVEKRAYGGDRSLESQYDSICMSDEANVCGEVVLLLDDVTTTGNSLYACKELLLENGASKVSMIALGQSI